MIVKKFASCFKIDILSYKFEHGNKIFKYNQKKDKIFILNLFAFQR